MTTLLDGREYHAVGNDSESLLPRKTDAPFPVHSAVTLATQYVMTSTEQQQYSAAIQADAIRQYASERGFQIVRRTLTKE